MENTQSSGESPLEKLRWERRRKLQVREAFRAGLTRYLQEPGDPVPFYLACARYLIPAQRRLIDQDLRLSDLLAGRVPAEQAADHEAIGSLKDRLRDSDTALGRFEAVTARLTREGAGARAAFEEGANAYIDFSVNVLGARSHSLRHLTTTLLTDADWEYITGLTPAVLAEEAELFEQIRQTAPAGCDPAQMSTAPPPRS